MPRQRSPSRDKAKQIWLESGKTALCKDIAKILNVSESQVRNWKVQDDWEEKNKIAQSNSNSCAIKRKKGGQAGNKNALNNDGGAPPENKNAEKHGFFSKYLPDDALEIMQEIETRSPIDMLWDNIKIHYAAIIRAQRIMYVTDKDEMIKVIKKEKYHEGLSSNTEEKEWEFQFAWDRQATFLNAQSRAMSELRSMIKQYEELMKTSLATEEQKLRIEKLKADIEKVKGKDDDKPIEIVIKRKGEGK